VTCGARTYEIRQAQVHAFWNSFASNVASPFVAFNVTAAGANAVLIGYVQSVGSLVSGVAFSAMSASSSLWTSLAYLYVVAAAGRAVGALLHLRLPYGDEGGGLEQGFYR
jgi:hypothetical protein